MSIKTPKAEAKPEPKVEAPKKGRGRPKGSKNKVEATTIEQRVDSLESKMDKILEILSRVLSLNTINLFMFLLLNLNT